MELFADLMKRVRPKTWQELHKHTPLRYLSKGAYRSAYQVISHPQIVVKFPQHVGKNPSPSAVSHTRQEIDSINRVNGGAKKWMAMRAFMPDIIYADKKTGVIALEFLRRPRGLCEERLLDVMWEVVNNVGVGADDHEANGGIDSKGMPKIIDVAYTGVVIS